MSSEPDPAQLAIRAAYLALRKGDRRAARRWAEQAARLNPESEEPWLLLAALGSPQASLDYLKRALEINPHSQRARKGMHWAAQRLRADPPALRMQPITGIQQPKVQTLTEPRPERAGTLLPLLVVVLLTLTAWFSWNYRPTIQLTFLPDVPQLLNQVSAFVTTPTPTFTATFTPTLTPTNIPTSTSTATPTPTETPTLTSTPTESPTETPPPTEVPEEPEEPKEEKPKESKEPKVKFPGLPAGVGKNERWVEVNLSRQTAAAYKGKKLVRSFVVSTGTWQHPTVTGQFKIYVKYRYADMAGPGYYLPNVPNVMYFYKDYGLHGTYWHDNFGTPMSHGCVNFSIDDSKWLYNFTSIGTVVYVHD